MIRTFARAATAAVSLALFAVPAFAHVTLQTPEAHVGAGYKAVLRVGHGCDGNATTTIRVKVPEGFLNAKPQPKAGWTLDITKGKYAKSYTLYGSEVTEGALEITWSGGNLPDDQYDEFALNGTLAADLDQSAPLYFPVVQTCTTGENAWIDTSGSEDGEPAPGLRLLPPAEADH